MAKYRFKRGPDGTIVVRAERKLGNQLISSITKVLAPGEDVSAAMKELYNAVHGPTHTEPFAPDRASERRLGE